jgi:hypothetical protein
MGMKVNYFTFGTALSETSEQSIIILTVVLPFSLTYAYCSLMYVQYENFISVNFTNVIFLYTYSVLC